MALVLSDYIKALLVHGHAAGIQKHTEPAGIGNFDLPLDCPVISIDSVDDAIARDEKTTVLEQGRHVSVVTIDHPARSGSAKPLDRHLALNDFIAAAGGITRFSVCVRPFTRAVQRRAPGPRQTDIACGLGFPINEGWPAPFFQLFRIELTGRQDQCKSSATGPEYAKDLAWCGWQFARLKGFI